MAERSNGKLLRSDFDYIASLTNRLSQLKAESPELGIKQVVDYRMPVLGPRLTSEVREGSGQATLILVSLNGTLSPGRLESRWIGFRNS